MDLKQKLVIELNDLYPAIKPLLAERYVNKYVDFLIPELQVALMRPVEDEVLSVNSTQLKRKMGRMDYNDEQIYIFDFMGRSDRTRLVNETYVGHKGIYKKVIINPIYQDDVLGRIAMTTTAPQPTNHPTDFTHVIPVNEATLLSFITESQNKLKNLNANSPLGMKITSDITLAKNIYANIENGVVKEKWEVKDTGRIYGMGISLQHAPKEVRHAALGDCYKYDFQACSFSIMASLAKSINPEIYTSFLEEYIKHRAPIRESIANQVGVPVDVIKRVFTSLGFGARVVNNLFSSIRKELPNDAAYEALLNCEQFKYIKEELDVVNQTIENYDAFKNSFDINEYHFNEKTEGGRKKTSAQRLAWIYQCFEAQLMNRVVDEIKKRTGMEPLLTVHDCVYYKQSIPANTLADIRYIITQIFPFARIEKEVIYPITTKEFYNNRFAEQNQREEEHRQRIYEEEQLARNYQSQFFEQVDIVMPKEKQSKEYEFDFDNDPFFQSLTKVEQKEYIDQRNELLGITPKVNTGMPDWVNEIIQNRG